MFKSASISQSEEYILFRSSVQLKKVQAGDDRSTVWKVFDCGRKTAEQHRAPVVFLPPMEATCDAFFKQMNFLSARGYRALSLGYPAYGSAREFCVGFHNVLEVLGIFKVDVFACGLGGFFLSHFLQTFRYNRLVRSAVFCNAFTNTASVPFAHHAFSLMPKFHLKKIMLRSLNPKTNSSNGSCMSQDIEGDDVFEFIEECTQSFTKKELVARLKCRYSGDFASNLNRLQEFPITVIQTLDDSEEFESEKSDMYKSFPNSTFAEIKSGGRFPFLSQHSIVNLHLLIHLRKLQQN